MNASAFLKKNLSILGLDAPAFAWIAALVLLAGTALLLVWLYVLVRRGRSRFASASRAIEAMQAEYLAAPGEGVPAAVCDALEVTFRGSPELARAWRNFASQMVRDRDASGQARLFTPDSAAVTFSEAAVIDPMLDRNLFNAVPGMVTGTGLLVTFIAILLALLDVKLVDNRVEGLNFLIEGLSGKFVSSIAALFAATIFLLIEKPLMHRLNLERLDLVAALDGLIPRLSTAALLASLRDQVASQTNAFQSFTADLSLKPQTAVIENMGAVLQRMAVTVEGLNHVLREAETHRRETVSAATDSAAAAVDFQEEMMSQAEGLNTSLRLLIEQMSEITGKKVDPWTGETAVQLDKLMKKQRGEQPAPAPAARQGWLPRRRRT